MKITRMDAYCFQNLETARAVEAIIRSGGAVPATVCVLGGVAHVGTDDADLARLAELGLKVRKTGTRDLPLLMSGIGAGDGATTGIFRLHSCRQACMHVHTHK